MQKNFPTKIYCPVPLQQRPFNEYLNFKKSFFVVQRVLIVDFLLFYFLLNKSDKTNQTICLQILSL